MSAPAQAPTVRAEYDREADALYIRLREGDVARSVEVDDVRVVDLDTTGAPIGVEILYPAENLAIASIARDFGFEHLLAEIDDAVVAELGPATYHTSVGISLDYGTLLASLTPPSKISVPSSGTAVSGPRVTILTRERA